MYVCICTKVGCSRIISCYVKMTILSAKEASFASLRFKGSESTKKDQITENTVA